MKALTITCTLFFAGNAFAALENYDSTSPVGQYGDVANKWQPSWSEAFFKCMDRFPQAQTLVKNITTYKVQDVGAGKKWCTSRDLTDPAQAKQFLLGTFKVLAGNESSYRPWADNGQSPHPPALGLFQIGTGDAKAYGCQKPGGGAVVSQEDLKVAENNVCCAVKIAAAQSTSGKNGGVFAEGATGIMGAFWEPMRKQHSNGAKQDEMVGKVNNACTQIGRAGGLFTSAEIESSRRVGVAAMAGPDEVSGSVR